MVALCEYLQKYRLWCEYHAYSKEMDTGTTFMVEQFIDNNDWTCQAKQNTQQKQTGFQRLNTLNSRWETNWNQWLQERAQWVCHSKVRVVFFWSSLITKSDILFADEINLWADE